MTTLKDILIDAVQDLEELIFDKEFELAREEVDEEKVFLNQKYQQQKIELIEDTVDIIIRRLIK